MGVYMTCAAMATEKMETKEEEEQGLPKRVQVICLTNCTVLLCFKFYSNTWRLKMQELRLECQELI